MRLFQNAIHFERATINAATAHGFIVATDRRWRTGQSADGDQPVLKITGCRKINRVKHLQADDSTDRLCAVEDIMRRRAGMRTLVCSLLIGLPRPSASAGSVGHDSGRRTSKQKQHPHRRSGHDPMFSKRYRRRASPTQLRREPSPRSSHRRSVSAPCAPRIQRDHQDDGSGRAPSAVGHSTTGSDEPGR